MHRLKIFTFLTVSFLLVSNGIAQQKILLSKAKIHVGNGKVINQGLVGIDGEEIVLVENALTFTYDKTAWDTIIDLKGQELYPGFIAPNSTLGLTEVDAVRATRDFNEVGVFNPHVRSQIAFNAESEINTTVKTNGVLYTQTTPQGGIISGTSSLMKLEAWNWEDATLKKDDGIHLNWPSTTKGGGWWAEPAPKKINDKYTEDVIKIRNFFEAALAYSESDDLYDARFEAMRAVFTGTKRVYFHANELRALTDIIDFKREFSIQYPVIIGGYEAYKIADQLIDAEIPIIIKGGHTLPTNEDDPVDLPYRLPALLQEAGILFCIQNSGRMETMNTRNIPFLAGTAMAYGLSEEQAISAVSLNTAKIMGVDQIAGSIEVGKKATLFASKGSALDMRTNELTLGMIHGKFIQLTNLQTKLYEKYKEKYKSK
ncbi:amidohydrolase [Brumimicrobium salinarum]|uniref:Amidohydrolase n=1 Tax=Brumimicrobium salinarum TaxID=2058658 RepID=A0A2I0R4F6_9FLAO|nr:amidohydrolase family protein [Brumimicrobium salinarum]PKR81464.1 amidohydrolase [Brumimicrobium salinarum]